MQQFYALFKKEFCGYFQSYFVLAVIFVYLLSSIGAAFYASYFDMHDTALYSLFNMQLYIQAALIPALTMKLWADEYKSGTAEFLLTQPLEYYKPVLAKFSAAFAFALFMSLLLLVFIFEVSLQINIDWQNIICCYFGLWSVIFVFCAGGSLISALSKNVISVYLLSLFFTVFAITVSATGLRAAYTDFLLAEVELGDVFYFLMTGSIFLFLNTWVLQVRASVQKYKFFRLLGLGFLLLAGMIALCFSVYTLFPHKYDFTASKIYTPRPESIEIIRSLENPISIDVFISEDYIKHNTEYARYYQQVMRFLRNAEKLSGKKIKVRSIRVRPFSKLEEAVLKSDLYYEENIYGSKDYFGAVIRDADGTGVVIKHFTAARLSFLEKDIDIALLKLSRDDVVKTIGVYLDMTQNLEEFQGVMLNLENDYIVLNTSDNVYGISPELDLLLLVNPKEVKKSFKIAVDKYIAEGGKVVLLFDFFTKNQSNYTNMQNFSFLNFINAWGIEFSGNMVDTGAPSSEYAASGLPVVLYKAVDFGIKDKGLSVTPLITHEENLVGALIKGKFSPIYAKNNSPNTAEGQVAVFGDVDFIIDDNWISEQAVDKNPYSAVFKSSNIEILRNVIDRMTGNSIYLSLPVRYERQNIFSIGEKIYQEIYDHDSPEYFRLSAELIDARSALSAGADSRQDKIMQMMESGAAGQKISELELQAENLLYKMSKEYKISLRIMFLAQAVVMPLLTVFLLFWLIFFIRRRQLKKISEFAND